MAKKKPTGLSIQDVERINERHRWFEHERLKEKLARGRRQPALSPYRMLLSEATEENVDPDNLVGIEQYHIKQCKECGTTFLGQSTTDFCSVECQRRNHNQRRRKYHEKPLEAVCAMCSKPIEGAARASRRFCSNACRQASYRQRHDNQ